MLTAMRRRLLLAGLLGVTAVWGLTFVTVKEAVETYPVFAFLAIRFAIATVSFVALFPGSAMRIRRSMLPTGLLAGSLLTVGYVAQTVGLQWTLASRAAFITGLFVVLTPLIEFVWIGRRPGWGAGAGIALAVPGLWLLTGANLSGWGAGEWLLLLCAVAFAAHLVSLAVKGRAHDPLPLTTVQLAVAALVCGAVSLSTETATWPTSSEVWLALLLTGVLASAAAYAIQTYALRYLSATRTALIMVMEPVFGGLFGWLLAGEVFGVAGSFGAGLILGGMLTSELSRLRKPRVRMLPDIEGTVAPAVVDPDEVVEDPHPTVERSLDRRALPAILSDAPNGDQTGP